MFGLFVNDILNNFWGNSIGDIFLSNTCSKLELNPSNVDLVYYTGLRNVPAHYIFDVNKNLIIQNEVVTPTQVATLDENGDQVLDENLEPIYHNEDVISYETASTITADFYSSKGIMVKVC